LIPGAETGGTFPAIRASNTPDPPTGEGGFKPGAAIGSGPAGGLGGRGEPRTGGAGGLIPGAVIPGGGKGGLMEGADEDEPGAGAAAAGFLIFEGKLKIKWVPGSDFSAVAPPPWAWRMVFTRANLSPVPASWVEAVCFGS
jgi:hypothetical protein